jgi:hypothetical protein
LDGGESITATCGGFDGGESITATCGGFDGGESITATCGGFDGGESITATCGGFDGGESITATCGGFDGGESITAACGGFDGGESIIANAELATAQPATKAITLTFIMNAPNGLLSAAMRDTVIRLPAQVTATPAQESPHLSVTMYA